MNSKGERRAKNDKSIWKEKSRKILYKFKQENQRENPTLSYVKQFKVKGHKNEY